MAWVVDTCLVIDVLDDDPACGAASAGLLDTHADAGLVLCPVSYVELAPAFLGDPHRQREFLDKVGIQYLLCWDWIDTARAHTGWHTHVSRRRSREGGRRPVADVLIGAFALRFDGLLTRNAADFQALFPSLRLASPSCPDSSPYGESRIHPHVHSDKPETSGG
jgi:predicted nucleic acid-binding protein